MRTVPLATVADINPRGNRPADDESISFVGMAQLDAESAEARPLESRPFSDVSKGYTVFQHGDILAAKITPCWENGKIGQAVLDHPTGVGSTEFHVIRPSDKIDSRYLLHFLRQSHVRSDGELRMAGSGGQRRVPRAFLSALQISLPHIDEQRRIAAILDHADALHAKRRRILDHLDELVEAAFIEMFGQPNSWRERWTIGKIGDIASSADYGTSRRADRSGEYPILRMGNVTDSGRIDLSDLKFVNLPSRELTKATTRRGDLLFNRTNSKEKVGKTGVVRTDRQFAIAGYLVRLRLQENNDPEFVAYLLNGSYGRSVRQHLAKNAINQANINASELLAIEIPIPPASVQQRYGRRVAAIEQSRTRVIEGVAEDDRLFAALQSRAFRGEL